MKIFAMMTGGTIAQREKNGRMHIALGIDSLIADLPIDSDIETFEIDASSGANIGFDIVFSIRDLIQQNADKYDGFLLVTGTDSMEEIAFALDLLLDIDKPVVITGAMKPSDIIGYDGRANLLQALQTAGDKRLAGQGVFIVMNDDVHIARYVRKQDSQLIGAFVSHPGPIGQFRAGKLILYFTDLPRLKKFSTLRISDIKKKVMIWTMSVDPYFPFESLTHLDGLIIAGMGAGSISDNLFEELSDHWTSKLPIVLSSRCLVGSSFDDYCYRGSRTKYENKGFILSEYEQLNPLQSRIKLIFELSKVD